MKKVLVLLFAFIGFTAAAQQKINVQLKRQLDSVWALDQQYREAMTLLLDPAKSDSVAKSLSLTVAGARNYYDGKQRHIDSLNIRFIEAVFSKYGYPGKKLVGEPTNEAAWNLVQHSAKIDTYLPLIEKAAEQKDLPFYLYGMMLDRQLMSEGKEQIYGSQLTCRKIKTGKSECFVWPIKDPENVNKRREEAGFKLTVEKNAERLGTPYKVMKLSEVQ